MKFSVVFTGSDTKRSASGKGAKKGTKRSPSPIEVPPAEAEAPASADVPAPAQPGDDDWECVKEPVDLVSFSHFVSIDV